MARRDGADAYVGDTGPESKSLLVRFSLEKAEAFSASGIPCQVMRDGVSTGMIFLKEEWEFKQLKEKIDGLYTEDESLDTRGIVL